MPKRLRIVLRDSEYLEIKRLARLRRISISEWVHKALTTARHRESVGNIEKKLKALRTAMKFEFATGDIGDILAEIERGYLGDDKKSS